MKHRRPDQPTLVDTPETGYRRRTCRECGRPLTKPSSRLAGYGEDCDPENRPGSTPDHHIEQEPLPGI